MSSTTLPAVPLPLSAPPVALQSLRDETLESTSPASCNLYLTAGANGLRVGVVDIRRNKFVALEDYPLNAEACWADQFRALARENDLLGQTTWNQVRLAVQNRCFTLLPAPLLRAGDEAAYLRLHHAVDPDQEMVGRYGHSSMEMVSVFAVEKALASWFQATYPTGKILHQTSALLEGILHQSEVAAPRRLYLSLGHQEVTIVAVRGKHLEFCNVFAFATPEDLIYYTILVMQELHLNPDQDGVVVWGDLMHDSELFTILRKYIRNIRFGNRPFDLAYSYRLNDVFEYRYFELYSLHLCE